MATVNINLIAYHQQFTLSKELLLSRLPESLLGQAIAGDPDCLEVDIANPDVTPATLQIISDWLLGLGEPKTVITDAKFSAKYLNIPWLEIYSNPLYGKLDHPVTDSKTNQWMLKEAAGIGDIDMVKYLMYKAVSLIDIQEVDSFEVYDSDSPYTEYEMEWYSPALDASIWGGHLEIYKLLLAQPIMRRINYDEWSYISRAIESDSVAGLKRLPFSIKETPMKLWECAYHNQASEVMAYLLETYHETLAIVAIWNTANKQKDAELFWLVHPYMIFNYPDDAVLKTAIDDDDDELVQIILEDSNFTPYLGVYLNYAETHNKPHMVNYITESISLAQEEPMKIYVKLNGCDYPIRAVSSNFLSA